MSVFTDDPIHQETKSDDAPNQPLNVHEIVDTLLKRDISPRPRGPLIRDAQAIAEQIRIRTAMGDFHDVVSCDRRVAERRKRRTNRKQAMTIGKKGGNADRGEGEGEDAEEDDDSETSEDDEEVKRMDFAESILLNSGKSRISYTYLQFLKYIRYIMATNRQGTLITLIYIRHMNFRSKDVAQAFDVSQCTTLLLNLLSVDDPPVQIAAMRVLDKVSSFAYFARLIVHLGGVKLLLNNLYDPNIQMKRAAGRIIGNLCILKKARMLLAKMNAIKPIVCLLDENTKKIAALHTDYERRIRMLIAFNTAPEKTLKAKLRNLEKLAESKRRQTDSLLRILGVVLCALSKNPEGRLALQQAGMVSVFTTLIPLAHSDVLGSVMSTLQACCVDEYFRIAILTEGILPHLLECLSTSHLSVKLPCTFTLSQCAEEQAIRDEIRKMNGLDVIVRFLRWEVRNPKGALENIRMAFMVRGQAFDEEGFVNSLLRLQDRSELRTPSPHSRVSIVINKTCVFKSPQEELSAEARERAQAVNVAHETFLVGLTELIWKTSLSEENVKIYHEKRLIGDLMRLVVELPRLFGPFRRPATTASAKLNGLDRAEKVVLHCLFALSLVAQLPVVRKNIARSPHGVKPWIVLLRLAIIDLIPAVCISLRVLLQNKKLREQFVGFGGLRLLFAYVNTEAGEARREALQTIETCLRYSDDVRRLIKPLVTSTSVVVAFVSTMATDEATQIAALDLIAQMARDSNTLAIMSDLGVIEGLSRILEWAYTDALKISVSRTISACSYYGKNAQFLGEANCVPLLAENARSDNHELRNVAVRALYGLSHVPANVAKIWEANICSILIEVSGSSATQVQLAAAGTLSRIRQLEFQGTCNKGE
ncbi:unnamed protein product [Mesocestoides corti]|uniref:Kinesin-like protein n=1 Tax=Mesocestoides corti TaxID=53468 RepID=A0A0R3UMK6_MESCO|nr:unnamed protein product [Mesocestoides corti]